MAKLSFFHDTRSGNGEFPLKLRIAHKGKTAYINLDIKLPVECWDDNEQKIVEHPKQKALNDFLITKKAMMESAIMTFGLTNNLDKLTVAQIKTVAETNGETATKQYGHSFVRFYEKMMEQQERRKTKLSYESALKKIKETDPLIDTKTFEDITTEYIQGLDDDWKKKGLTTNARAVYMRNIRSVINKARKQKLTTTYAFLEFSIKKEPTQKRNLSVEELRMLRDYPIVNEFQKKYRDFFMLCFYLRGINIVDLCGLTKANVRLGRINYVRSKTGKSYSVKIEPEAKMLLDRYKGKDYLVDICDGAKTKKEFDAKYEGFLQRMDRGLKKIGPYTRKGLGGKKEIKPILPFISQYWCRHTCATLMHQKGYSNEIIACSLGHEHGNPTTNIYIEYNETEVDKANRDIIDFVNKKEDECTTGQKSGRKGQRTGRKARDKRG